MSVIDRLPWSNAVSDLEIPASTLSLEQAMWVLVIAGLVADLVTTQAGLAAGYEESNPIARSALEYGPAGILAMKTGAIGVGFLCRPILPAIYRPIIPAALAIPWMGAAALNTLLIVGVVP